MFAATAACLEKSPACGGVLFSAKLNACYRKGGSARMQAQYDSEDKVGGDFDARRLWERMLSASKYGRRPAHGPAYPRPSDSPAALAPCV